ncbi:hypothetical protein EDB87DRAFT_1686958 [Lactarius vividus]|nr:hypothetical protein EDB87DRAFT_1686958 [Lactarius vividus]
MAPLAPFRTDLSAAHHATTGEEDSPAHDMRGYVANGLEDRAALGCGNSAAPSSTAVARLGKSYPNKEISKGVWEFHVEVVDDNIKHTFNAHTDMKWYEFLDEVHRHFERPRSEVHVAFRISGDAGAMSYLASEYDWNDAIAWLLGKVWSTWMRAVSMEIKNMQPSTTLKAHSTKRGKEKCRREDDIPPESTLDMLDHILELRQHLLCQAHSKPGNKVYCTIEQLGEDGKGGHRQLTSRQISLWAKLILFDHPPTKKSRATHALPEVHVSVNITPASEAGSSKMQVTYVPSGSLSPAPSPSGPDVTCTRGAGGPPVQVIDTVSDSSLPSPSPSGPAQPISNSLPVLGSIVPVPGPIVPTPVPAQEPIIPHQSLLLVLLDCLGTSTLPSLMNVLLLMDAYHPVGPRYVGLHDELTDMGIDDVVDLYSLPVELLATFGWLRQGSACHLQSFCCDRLLIPLGFVEEIVSNNHIILNDSPSTQQMGVSGSEIGNDKLTADVVQVWLDEGEEINEHQMSVRSGEVDEGEQGGEEEGGDMATQDM